MKNKDQVAIFESYRDDILNKFKQDVLGGDSESENNVDVDDIEDDIEDDDTDVEPTPKKNVVIKSEEIGVNLGLALRSILRNLPSLSEDTEILSNLKRAIEKTNSALDDEDQIKESPLNIYTKLIELGILREEEMNEDEINDEDKEVDLLQSFEDDEYDNDDDLSRLGKRSDFAKGMSRDVERSRMEDEIRRMGTDWRGQDEDFLSSNY
jgi:hypothetical protein